MVICGADELGVCSILCTIIDINKIKALFHLTSGHMENAYRCPSVHPLMHNTGQKFPS